MLRRFSLLLAFCIALAAWSKSTFENPDFSYPQDVIHTADSVLNSPAASDLDRVNAVTQFATAKLLFDYDSVAVVYNRINQTAERITQPDAKALILIYKAAFLRSVHSMSHGDIDAPLDPLPDNPEMWSNEQFISQINPLIDQAIQTLEPVQLNPITQYGSIVSWYPFQKPEITTQLKYSPYLRDLIYYMATEYVINSGNQSLRNKYIDQMCQLAQVGTLEWVEWNSLRPDFDPIALYDLAPNGDVRAALLIEAVKNFRWSQQTEQQGHQLISLIETQLRQFSLTHPFKQDLNRALDLLHLSTLEMNSPSGTYAPNDTIHLAFNYRWCRKIGFAVYDKLNTNANFDKQSPLFIKDIDTEYSGVALNDTISFALNRPGRFYIRLRIDGKYIDSNVGLLKLNPFIPTLIGHDEQNIITLFDADSKKPAGGINLGIILPDGTFKSLGKTNSQGVLTIDHNLIPEGYRTEMVCRHKGDTFPTDIYLSNRNYPRSSSYRDIYRVELFTSRPIYHRGDTLDFSLLVYNLTTDKVLPNHSLDLEVTDANNNVFTTLTVITDEFGRASGQVALPDDCLAGQYSIYARGIEFLSHGNVFTVSDFKIAKYQITDLDVNIDANDQCVVTGRCITFSGAAVAYANVVLNINESYWYRKSDRPLFQTNATTDVDGSFRITCALDSVKHDIAYSAMFHLIATDPAGNTAELEKSVPVHHSTWVNFSFEKQYNLDQPITVNGGVYNAARNPLEVDLVWHLLADNHREVASGLFKSSVSGTATFDFSQIPAGKYILSIAPVDSTFAEPDQSRLILYSINQNAVPAEADCILLQSDITADAQGRAQIQIGYPSARHIILLSSFNNNDKVSSKAIEHRAGFNTINVKLPDGCNHAEYIISYPYGYKLITITRPEPADFSIAVESWRDNAIAGQPCHWRFTLTRTDGSPASAALVASLYNHALDLLASPIKPISASQFTPNISLLSVDSWTYISNLGMYSRVHLPHREWVSEQAMHWLHFINDYPIKIFDGSIYPCSSYAYRSTLSASPNVIEAEVVFDESDGLYEVVECEPSAAPAMGKAAERTSSSNLRQGDVLQAFWMPALSTNPDGSVTLDFQLPNANGQWALVLNAWTTDLHSNGLRQIITTSKPLMTQPTLPRFLRHGDRATLCATFFNTSDSALCANASFEVFIPDNDSIIASSSQVISIEPHASAIGSITLDIPSNISSIGVRVKAAAGNFSDGEVNLIPVLEASNTVVESSTFYLNKSNPVFEATLPDNLGVNAVLQYCQNPIWEAVKALPELFTGDTHTAPGAAYALFGAVTAQAINSQHPEVLQGINRWMAEQDQPALTSALLKNEDIKLASLRQTPWMAAAASQSQRMQRIAASLSSDNASSVTAKAIERLAKLQNTDGGFRWVDCFETSSAWTTMSVLKTLGLANSTGSLPDDDNLSAIIDAAFSFLDHNTKDKELEYTLIYSLFPDRKPSTIEGQEAIGNTIEDILRRKSSLTTSSRAVAALVLEANGRHASAMEMLRSLRQFQANSPQAGISYPSVNGIDSYAHILTAFARIDPKPDELDAMRQWIVLRAQVTDDLGSWHPAYLIWAILNSGSLWTTLPADASNITINGHAISPDTFEQLTGNIVYHIPADLSGAALRIDRPADSAVSYGSLTTISTRPISDIQAHAIPEISITKRILARRNGQWVETTDLILGEQVTVDLTVISTRDLEYVTIIDNRAACLEPLPAEQLPRPVWLNGALFYREHNNQTSNLFANYLPRGSYHFQFTMTVASAGQFASGIASVQSQLAPEITAHSAAASLSAK